MTLFLTFCSEIASLHPWIITVFYKIWICFLQEMFWYTPFHIWCTKSHIAFTKLILIFSFYGRNGLSAAFQMLLGIFSDLSLTVFLCFLRYIIGKKGETRKRLESETKTSISIPKQGVEGQIGEKQWFEQTPRLWTIKVIHPTAFVQTEIISQTPREWIKKASAKCISMHKLIMP